MKPRSRSSSCGSAYETPSGTWTFLTLLLQCSSGSRNSRSSARIPSRSRAAKDWHRDASVDALLEGEVQGLVEGVEHLDCGCEERRVVLDPLDFEALRPGRNVFGTC